MTQAPSNALANANRGQKALEVMAERLQVDATKLAASLSATVFKGATPEELLSLVVVSNQYQLNPFLRQIYAFPRQGGGIVPIVGIDGWSAIVNSQTSCNGFDFSFEDDENGKPFSCTCTMHIKGREHPVKVTEYFSECYRNTPPWNQMGRRMLRHKAFMQTARLAYGLGGIYDEDEARDIATNAVVATVVPEGGSKVERLAKRLKGETAPAPDPAPQQQAPLDNPAPTQEELPPKPASDDVGQSEPPTIEQIAQDFAASFKGTPAAEKYLNGLNPAVLEAAKKKFGLATITKQPLETLRPVIAEVKLAELQLAEENNAAQ